MKKDLNHGIYALYRIYRNSEESADTKRTKKAADLCGDLVKDICSNEKEFDIIWDSICDYGEERDYQGYREGFMQGWSIANDMEKLRKIHGQM